MLTLLLTLSLEATADTFDQLRARLEDGGQRLLQEKVYIHTDNENYFVGDTLWYKAYVVRADDLRPTNLSRILYVELLSPDGLLVERQQIVVSGTGHTCGQFVLTDSLYSGYYELRAYTRWMLNFNVSHYPFHSSEVSAFYNRQMCEDYYRVWDGLFQRVFPVYSKPETPGDYDARRMYQRPKTRIPKPKREKLHVTFYPEGGNLVEGLPCHVAFEAVDQNGEAVNLRGTLGEGPTATTLATEYMGRGSFVVAPTGRLPKARFTWHGHDYSFDLPRAIRQGVALHVAGDSVELQVSPSLVGRQYALALLSGGRLRQFRTFTATSQPQKLCLTADTLPEGVADAVVFDADGRVAADRLFFVRHQVMAASAITASIVSNHTYEPYELIELPVTISGINAPTTFSLSLRDKATDEPTYDDGNILTSLLLSSEVKGFVAKPRYYFEAADAKRRRHLDLLMMVQGWRRYDATQLADTTFKPRYKPELTMTVEGEVYKTPSIPEIMLHDANDSSLQGEVARWRNNSVYVGEGNGPKGASYDRPLFYLSDIGMGINNKVTHRHLIVEAEVTIGKQTAGGTQNISDGHFLFQIPPFYGTAVLNMKAYAVGDSVKKNMQSRSDKHMLREDWPPDYYVRRCLFYPMQTRDYDFYQTHQPDYFGEMLIDTLSELSMENDVHQLANVNVRGHRRGRRSTDWTKPAYVADVYDLYNMMTDYGLSFGEFDRRIFPLQAARFLVGNMARSYTINVDGRIGKHVYWRNYTTQLEEARASIAGSELEEEADVRSFSDTELIDNLRLKRLDVVRIFTDYDARKRDSTIEASVNEADLTIEMVPFEEGVVQPTFRDRHIFLPGMNAPAEFYHPDYSQRVPSDGSDHRRTLYWNPNAVTDAEGRLTVRFYNSGKQTRIAMSAAAVTPDGRILSSE